MKITETINVSDKNDTKNMVSDILNSTTKILLKFTSTKLAEKNSTLKTTTKKKIKLKPTKEITDYGNFFNLNF